MKWEKFYKKIRNNQKNVKFDDIVNFLEYLEFKRISKGSSHEIYKRNGVPERVNIQENKGEVKPYQVKQILRIVDTYKLV